MSDQIVEACASNQGRYRSNATNDFTRSRRVNPMPSLSLDRELRRVAAACPASEQVRPCTSRSHAFALSQANEQGRAGKVEAGGESR
jgi:hypothetical protein